ncbi:MAG: hypothetical protein M0Z92_14145 [Actinomycetota bacterium]|nr:hypothetical protein [Actinomycetota bacterium]
MYNNPDPKPVSARRILNAADGLTEARRRRQQIANFWARRTFEPDRVKKASEADEAALRAEEALDAGRKAYRDASREAKHDPKIRPRREAFAAYEKAGGKLSYVEFKAAL